MATEVSHNQDCSTGGANICWRRQLLMRSTSLIARTDVLRLELTLVRGSMPVVPSDSARCHLVNCDMEPYQRTGSSENWIGCCPMSLAVVL